MMSAKWPAPMRDKEKHEFKLRLLTPLWTGDIDGNSNRAVESGIIGSLRWWFEGLVRGMGGFACDPTSDSRCILDTNDAKIDINEAVKKICPVCRVFGCTGLKRAFGISVVGLTTIPQFFVTDGLFKNSWALETFFKHDQNQLWPSGKDQTFQLVFRPNLVILKTVGIDEGAFLDIIKYLLNEIAQRGGLGARTQHGYGQVSLVNSEGDYFDDIINKAKSQIGTFIQVQKKQLCDDEYNKKLKSTTMYFNAAKMFTDIYEFTPPAVYTGQAASIVGNAECHEQLKNIFLPISYDIRYRMVPDEKIKSIGLRNFLKNKGTSYISMFKIVGYANLKGKTESLVKKALGPEKWASSVFISHLYKPDSSPNGKWRLKVWGYSTDPHTISTGNLQTAVRQYLLCIDGNECGWNKQLLDYLAQRFPQPDQTVKRNKSFGERKLIATLTA